MIIMNMIFITAANSNLEKFYVKQKCVSQFTRHFAKKLIF